MNVIKQIVKDGQTIKMVVKDNERGPKGDDGAIHYTAGAGIYISPENVISTRGAGGEVLWGDITGTLSDQTDLKNALDEKQDVLTAGDGIEIHGNEQDQTVIEATAVVRPTTFFTNARDARIDEYTVSIINNSKYVIAESEEFADAPLKVYVCGNSWQNGIPSQTSPKAIYSAGGTQTIRIISQALGQSEQVYNVSLSSYGVLRSVYYGFPFSGDGPTSSQNDIIYKSGSDWYIHRAINYVNLDGSSDEVWNTSGKTFYVTISDKKKSPYALCDYFINTSDFSDTDTTYRGYFTCDKSATGIYFMPLQDQTLAEFKTWLSSHPVQVCYQLATPTETKITNATLISNLEALEAARSSVVYTEIITTNDSLDTYVPIAIVVTGTRSTIRTLNDSIEDLATTVSNLPTVNNATLTIQNNNTDVATFTANSSTNVTANITTPVITMTSTDPGEGQPLAANNFIAVYEP